MTQMAGDIRLDRLRAALLELGEQQRTIRWLTKLVRAGWTWGAALLCVLLLDAIAPLPGEARVVMDVLLLAGIPIGLLLTRTRDPDRRRGPLRDARRLETHHDLPHNPLVNGLFLSPLTARRDDTLVAALAGRTHERAQDTIERIDRQVVVDRRALRREWTWAAVSALTWLATLIAAPGIVGTGLARLVAPFRDVPPFSFTKIEMAADPREPFMGDDVILTARTFGDPVRRMELVQLDDDLRPLHRWPMPSRGDAAFVRTLRAVTEPMLVQAEANGTRSKRLRLVPQAHPPVESEEDQANHSPSREARQPRPMPSPAPNETFDLAREFSEIHAQLAQLEAQARRIGEIAEQLRALEPGSPQYPQQLDVLEAELASFRDNAAALAAQCRTAASGATPRQQQMLNALAEALDALGLCRLGSCPRPGIGFGQGAGIGGGGRFDGPFGNWMTGLQTAQLTDLQLLTRMMENLGLSASPFGDAGPRNAHATAPPGDPDPTVGGTYGETFDPADDPGTIPSEAVMQHVPLAYRPLVRRYYERLAEDERTSP